MSPPETVTFAVFAPVIIVVSTGMVISKYPVVENGAPLAFDITINRCVQPIELPLAVTVPPPLTM
jgi:hypothetical protein